MPEDTATDLYAAMQLPAAARLDERMAKHLFYQQPKFTRRDEALFTKDIERITLRYALTPETTHLAPYRDDVREYGDVLVLEIALRQAARRQRIAELFWQYLPRPQVLRSLPPLSKDRRASGQPAHSLRREFPARL